MVKYETMLLFSPELEEDARNAIIENLTGVITREGGQVAELDHWGMRTLAYPVKKQTRGYYLRVVYDAPGALVIELERNIRIADGILKFITVKLAKSPEEQEG
ncbi:MAG: 30S ribosomal protein S6 [Desulfovibrionaceae bacterium]